MLTVAVLSWGSENTLYNTLKSFAYHGLAAEQRIALLQEGTPFQEGICREFKFQPISYPINVGIARGYKILLEQATAPNFLFLENDWELLRYPHDQLETGMHLLATHAIDIARFRHRTNPGNPLWTRQFEGQEYVRPSHLLDSIHWTDPDKFPEISTVDFSTESGESKLRWYITNATYANWTNNPHMGRTGWLRERVAPRLGDKDLEVDIQGWWEQQSMIRVGQSEGLFTHNRLD